MARIRYIKPDFWKDEDIAELPHFLRLFYIALWNFADKEGRLEDRPKWLKVEIFPYEKADILKMLEKLAKPKFNSGRPYIRRYKKGEKKYIQIIAWKNHQKPHHQEPDSKIPEPPIYNINNISSNDFNSKGDRDFNFKGDGDFNFKGDGECASSTMVEPTPNLLGDSPNSKNDTEIIDIINDLNEVLGTQYKNTTKIIRNLIKARLNDGFTIENFKTVHKKMFKAWSCDSKMVKFLRPHTLYTEKFDAYLNMPEADNRISDTGKKNLVVFNEWAAKKQKEADNDANK